MAQIVKIPLAKLDWEKTPGKPAWAKVFRTDAKGNRAPSKPLIRCNCGEWSGIGLHHVHADGSVTASFFHATAAELAQMPDGDMFSSGCGWHVHLKLLDYDLGDFPPDPPRERPKTQPKGAPSAPPASANPVIARAEELIRKGWP